MLLREAAQVHNWELDYGSIALMWRGGCIIRSVFLGQIKAAFDKDSNLRSLLLAPFFLEALAKAQNGWRNTVVTAVNLGTILCYTPFLILLVSTCVMVLHNTIKNFNSFLAITFAVG